MKSKHVNLHRKSPHHKAFTLIELLVVIAIIALLLSIIVPALRKAKAHARALINRSNLKSLGLAADLYLTQNKDRFFPYPSTSSNPLWMEKIGHMVDNIEEVRFCSQTIQKIQEVEQEYTPGNSIWGTSPRPWLWGQSADPSNPNKKYEMGSYGFNGWLYSDANVWVPTADKNKPYTKRTELEAPYRTPLFLDANWVDGWAKNDNVLPATNYDYSMGDRTGGTTSSAIGRFVIDRHGPVTDVVYADAHAETISHADLWTLSWHKDAKPNFNPVIPKPVPLKK